MKNNLEAQDLSDFRERVIFVIREFAGVKYGYLEERFGISARKWKNVCNRTQQPSIEMVVALTTVRPYFLTWMLTGKVVNILQVNPTEDYIEELNDVFLEAMQTVISKKNNGN